MNERIRELADEAGIPAIDGEWDYNDRTLNKGFIQRLADLCH